MQLVVFRLKRSRFTTQNWSPLVRGYNFPLADFKEYTNDRLFSIDYSSHTSRKGWVIVDQTLDAFYHGNTIENPSKISKRTASFSDENYLFKSENGH